MNVQAADKAQLLTQLTRLLEAELATLAAAAKAARDAATHAESRAENKYDTRGLEASYLAGAQTGRAAELQSMLTAVRAALPRSFGADDKIAQGALVELLQESARSYVLLVPAGAGYRLKAEGLEVVTVTGQAPLGRALLGRRVGEELTVLAKTFEIVAIA